MMSWRVVLAAVLLTLAVFMASREPSSADGPQTFPNRAGQAGTVGFQDAQGPFFQSLGSNGRSCSTCHAAEAGWTITPQLVQARFEASDGRDPLFRTVDGSTSPAADVSTASARRSAYSLLLGKGLVRVGLPMPNGADFSLQAVDDPYGFAGPRELSLFRRPLPATNLRFLTSVMWDGRESPAGRSLRDDLASQAMDATRGHAQLLGDLSAAQIQQIVDFELGLTSAQVRTNASGDLSAGGANGGPVALSQLQTGQGPFDLFAAWRGSQPALAPPPPAPGRRRALLGPPPPADAPDQTPQTAIARGEAIFNQKRFPISDVPGLTDGRGQTAGTCATCHNAANVGNHVSPVLMNLGLTTAGRRSPDLPLYTLRCGGSTVQTTDPGAALITGHCADVGKFAVPVLRNLSARAPYFHNGSAATLGDVIDFYRQRFGIRFAPGEARDLVAFLAAL